MIYLPPPLEERLFNPEFLKNVKVWAHKHHLSAPGFLGLIKDLFVGKISKEEFLEILREEIGSEKIPLEWWKKNLEDLEWYIEKMRELREVKALEILPDLPLQLQEKLFDQKLSGYLSSLEKNHNLQPHSLQKLFDQVITGMKKPDKLPSSLLRLGMSKADAEILFRELVKNVFYPIKEYLELMYNTELPELNLPPQKDPYLEPLQ